jgi:hypothetical protein
MRTAEINCGYTDADMQLQSNISLPSCGYAVVEVLPTSCEVAIAYRKKFARALSKTLQLFLDEFL